ncbi:MAG: hypothetical protein PHQ19_10450 [Candidatus Krumholzibacteria bacterium]|nr:hypothetical protein [Candidatus Krumholzibacteria bacterium]
MGRGADIDISGVDPECYTSRRHVLFTLSMGRWWVENLSEGSRTELMTRSGPAPIRQGGRVCVENGDMLTLGDKVFVLRMER